MIRFKQKNVIIFLLGFVTSLVANNLQLSLNSDYSIPNYSSVVVTQPKKNLGREIVDRAFNESFADLVELCPQHKGNFKTCLKGLYELGQSTPYSRRWPWWFQTMLRDAIRFRELHGKWHDLHFKDLNLQLCVFEKGGTKKWRDLHCQAINSPHKKDKIMLCFLLQKRVPADAPKAVFLKDPLDRFLSGFIDKCVTRTVEKHCQPFSVFHDPNTGLVKDFLKDKQKLFEIYVDTFPLTWNLHFFPQSMYCGGLYRNFANYSFIGDMGNAFYQDLGRFTKQFPALEPFVEQVFHYGNLQNVTNQGVETKAASQTLEYYTPRTVRRVLEYTAIDYVMLGLPIPSWAERMLAIDANMMGIE
jgi:hypothetical protein